MSEKDESITQKWLELGETVAREYLRKRNEEVLRFFGIDPDEELTVEEHSASSGSFTWYPAEECRNDRLYWIEINSGVFKGTRCAAWRTGRDPDYPWVADLDPAVASEEHTHEGFVDSIVTVIHELTPE